MMTCSRDQLPEEIEVQYLHKKKYSPDKTKVERLFNTFVSNNNTKKVVEKRTCDNGDYIEHVIKTAFKCVHVSFQSTSTCNIVTVDALNICNTLAIIREIG